MAAPGLCSLQSVSFPRPLTKTTANPRVQRKALPGARVPTRGCRPPLCAEAQECWGVEDRAETQGWRTEQRQQVQWFEAKRLLVLALPVAFFLLRALACPCSLGFSSLLLVFAFPTGEPGGLANAWVGMGLLCAAEPWAPAGPEPRALFKDSDSPGKFCPCPCSASDLFLSPSCPPVPQPCCWTS